MSLRAGEMRHRLKFQSKADQTDPEYGGAPGADQWVDIATVWAKRTNNLRSDVEVVSGDAVVAPIRVRFDVYARQVSPAWRAVGVGGDHDGVVYDITNVGLSNDGSSTAVLCTSGATNG